MRAALMLLSLRRSSTFAPRGTRLLVTRRAAKEPADDAVVAAGAAERRERLDRELAALGFDAGDFATLAKVSSWGTGGVGHRGRGSAGLPCCRPVARKSSAGGARLH